MADVFLDATEALTTYVSALDTAVDPDLRNAEAAEKMRPFTAPDGPWRYAPQSERQKVLDTIAAEQQRRAGHALFQTEAAIRALEPQIADAIRQTQLPPSPEAAWTQRAGRMGLTAAELLQLGTLDELRRARFDRELARAQPATVLEAYERALADATDQEHASLIRVVEARFAAGWTGLKPDGDRQLAHAVRLGARINEAREARIPEAAQAARAALDRARARAQFARDLHKIAPQRPE